MLKDHQEREEEKQIKGYESRHHHIIGSHDVIGHMAITFL